MSNHTEAEVAKALKFLAAEYRLAGKGHWAASLEAGDNAESEQYAINAIIAALRTASQGEYKRQIDDVGVELERMIASRDFYARRVDALQAVQSTMRDPERKMVCDILANGETYEKPATPASASEAVPVVCPGCGCEAGVAHAPYWNHKGEWTAEAIWVCDRCDSERMLQLSLVPASAEPAYDRELSPLDRIEFALRDADFDLDEAFRIAHMATTPEVCEFHDRLRGKRDASGDYAGFATGYSPQMADCTCPSGGGSLRWPCPQHHDASGEVTMAAAIAAGDGTLHGAIDHWHELAIAVEAKLAEQQCDATNACHQAYQAVAVMLIDLGLFDSDRGEKLLDNLSQARVVHEDVLPWPSAEQQRAVVLIDRDMAESVMQLLYLASNGRENIFAHTAGEIRDLLAATQPQEGAGNG